MNLTPKHSPRSSVRFVSAAKSDPSLRTRRHVDQSAWSTSSHWPVAAPQCGGSSPGEQALFTDLTIPPWIQGDEQAPHGHGRRVLIDPCRIYPSPPHTDSELKHTVPLPALSYNASTGANEESDALEADEDGLRADPMQHDSRAHLPLSPPPTIPILPLMLPDEYDDSCDVDPPPPLEDPGGSMHPPTTSESNSFTHFPRSHSELPEDPQNTQDLLTPLSLPWYFRTEGRSYASVVSEEASHLPPRAAGTHGQEADFLMEDDMDEQMEEEDIVATQESGPEPPLSSESSIRYNRLFADATLSESGSKMHEPEEYAISSLGTSSYPPWMDRCDEIPYPPVGFLDHDAMDVLRFRNPFTQPLYSFDSSMSSDSATEGSGSSRGSLSPFADFFDGSSHTMTTSPESICAPLDAELGALTGSPAPFSFGEDDLDMLPPHSPSLRRASLLPPLDDHEDLLPSSPSRRKFSSLPDLPDIDMDCEPAIEPDLDIPSPRSPHRLLSLPGAETDDDLIVPDHFDPEPPPPIADGPSLGIYLPIATASADALIVSTRSPSPELEPDLAFSDADKQFISAAEYKALADLRAHLHWAERNAKRAEMSHAEEAQRIAARLRVSPSVPKSLGEDTPSPLQAGLDPRSAVRRELQVAEYRRAEARRVRKLEKERGKEVQALLRIKLLERPAGGCAPIRRDSRGKIVISSIPQLVARMVFKRRDTPRPRRPLNGARARSPLWQSLTADEVVFDEEVLDEVELGARIEEMEGDAAPVEDGTQVAIAEL